MNQSSAPVRVYGIDAWRAALLLLGPIAHSADLVARMYNWDSTLTVVAYGSHLFRMEAFFALSGFLAALSGIERTDWLKRRLTHLLVPLSTAWFLVLPLTALTFARALNQSFAWSVGNPNHLWFLATLALQTPLVWKLHEQGVVERLIKAAERRPCLFWSAVVCAITASQAFRVLLLHVTHVDQGIESIAFGVPYFSLFYLAAFIAARSDTLLQVLIRSRMWLIGPAMWFAAMTFHVVFAKEIRVSDRVDIDLAKIAISLATAITMTYFVLATALKVRFSHPAIKAMNRASYTVYLVHMVFVGLFVWLASLLGMHPIAMFGLGAAAAMIVSIAFHVVCVENSWIGSVLFAGRLPSRGTLDLFKAGILSGATEAEPSRATITNTNRHPTATITVAAMPTI